MRVSLSRWTIVSALVVGLSICSASGCRTGGAAGWGWSTPSWMSWNNWGWANNTTAVAQSKPSTTVPRPSSISTPQPTTSVAAGTGGPAGYPTATANASSTNPNYAANGYPAVSRGYSSPYSTQPAAAYQPAGGAGASGQVQPTVGYQTGPYGMTSAQTASAGATPAPAYGNPSYSQPSYPAASYPAPSGQPASGQTWNAPAAAPQGGSTYQTADHSNHAGYSAAGGYSQPAASAPTSYGAAASPAQGGYVPSASTYGTSGTAAYSQSAAPAPAPAPAATSGAWQGYSQPPAPYQGTSVQPAAAATVASAPPAAAPVPNGPAAAGTYPNVPAALATDATSYRPGSTAGGYGVQNAGFAQAPATGGTYNPGSAPAYGNTYTR